MAISVTVTVVYLSVVTWILSLDHQPRFELLVVQPKLPYSKQPKAVYDVRYYRPKSVSFSHHQFPGRIKIVFRLYTMEKKHLFRGVQGWSGLSFSSVDEWRCCVVKLLMD